MNGPSKHLDPAAAVSELLQTLQEERKRFDHLDETFSTWRTRLIAGEMPGPALAEALRTALEEHALAVAAGRKEIQNDWGPRLGHSPTAVRMSGVVESLPAPWKKQVETELEETRMSARRAEESLGRIANLVHSGLSLLDELVGALTGARSAKLYGRDGLVHESQGRPVFELRG